MNSLTDVPPDGGSVPLDSLTATEVWNTATASTQAGNLNSNSTMLYIAVSRKKILDINSRRIIVSKLSFSILLKNTD